MLMRAAKSRSKTEDPEQAKLKAKVKEEATISTKHEFHSFTRISLINYRSNQAKEMQRAEMEELRQRDANLTALQAIGPRKKPKLESDTTTTTAVNSFLFHHNFRYSFECYLNIAGGR